MTDIAQARIDIASAWIAGWGATTPFVIEDEGFDDDTHPEPPDEWARLSMRHVGPRPGANGPQVNLGGPGNRKFERGAIVFVQIFTPYEAGADRGDDLGHFALGIFEAKKIGAVTCEGGRVYEGQRDGKWRLTLVEVTAYYDETK